MEEESRSLKETVLKLTDELSKHSFKQTTSATTVPPVDGRLMEKDDVTEKLKEEVLQLKNEIAGLLKDNQGLNASLKSMKERSTVTKEWQELVEHAEQVVAENASLRRQQELQSEKMEEMKKEHQAMVSQLNTELYESKSERDSIEKELELQREAYVQLQERLNNVTIMSTGCVSMEDHRKTLEEFQRLVDGLAEKSEENSRTQTHQLKILQKENSSLVTKLTNATAAIARLEEEHLSLQKSNRKAHEKIEELQRELEASRDREVAAHIHLSSVVMQAEKAIAERDTFAHIAKYQQKHGKDDILPSGHRDVKGKRQPEMWSSGDKTERGRGDSYLDDLQYLRSLLQQNRIDLAACVENVK